MIWNLNVSTIMVKYSILKPSQHSTQWSNTCSTSDSVVIYFSYGNEETTHPPTHPQSHLMDVYDHTLGQLWFIYLNFTHTPNAVSGLW